MEPVTSVVDYAIELLGPFGTVSTRAMFGGHGIYLDGVLFAIVTQDALWLKGDAINRSEFEAAGCAPFSYARSGKTVVTSFFQAPADAMESPQAMIPWARSAYAAALRANAKRRATQVRLGAARARNAARGGALPHPAGSTRAASGRSSRKPRRDRAH